MKKQTLKPMAFALATLCVLLGAGVTLYSPSSTAADEAKDKKAAQKPALTVTTAKPQTASLPIKLNANGNVAAWQEAVIGSESNGLRLTDVRVNVGDVVRAG
ncbi:MAG: efflux transporter periplasmic adaptor subunit, partial [Janthinobacterium sp.]